jgi:hypothetical protein
LREKKMLDEAIRMIHRSMSNRSPINDALKAKPDCLTPEQLEKFAEDGSLEDPHLAGCSRCQTELALLKSFESSEPLPDEGAAVAWISARLEGNLGQIKGSRRSRESEASADAGSWFSRLFGGRTSRWLVPVAVALVVAVAGIVVMQNHRSDEPQLRADAGNAPIVYRSQEVRVVGPVGKLAEAPKSLQWKAFPGAARYKVSMMEVDDSPLWSDETSDLIVTIPGAVSAKMVPGKPVLWRVTALDRRGRVSASSQVQRFSVQLSPPGLPVGHSRTNH